MHPNTYCILLENQLEKVLVITRPEIFLNENIDPRKRKARNI